MWLNCGENMKKKQIQHVVPNLPSGWKIIREDATKASYVINPKSKAIAKATSMCKKQGATLVVHKRDGSLDTKVTKYAKRCKYSANRKEKTK